MKRIIKNKLKFKGDKAVSTDNKDKEVLDKETLDKETLDKETLDKEALDKETLETENTQDVESEAEKKEDSKEGDVASEDTVEAANKETVTEETVTEEALEEGASKTEEAKEDKKPKKDPRDEKIEELQDKVKRQLAEFENFRNRTDKEKSQMYEMGAKSVIEKILPVIDNFERGLEHAPEDGDPFGDGIKMVYKQMISELDSIGVKAIEAVGSDFDPNVHNAVMQVASEEYESGKVAQELQKGYKYRDTLVRPSMVAVVE